MYEAFFGLRSRPFTPAPSADRYFPAAGMEAARQVLGRCIDRSEGTGLLVGPAGTGKSLLGLVLAEQFRGTLDVAFLSSGRLGTRRELLQAILFELNLPYRGFEEGELRLSLIDYLSQPGNGRQGLFLFVDEAHTMPLRLLEELRLITNLIRHGQPRVRLVLAGGPVLEERFAHPKLEAFNQRLAARCYVEGLERHETSEYVCALTRAAGGNPDQIFQADALDAIQRATEGIPRLINQTCDHSLILGFANGQRLLTKAIVEEAWADLQQLPAPWNTAKGAEAVPATAAAANDIIEFGTLDGDETEEEPAAVPFRPLAATPTLTVTGPLEVDEVEASVVVETPCAEAQLTDIQNQLTALEEDFHPLPSLLTAVDVVYPPAEHPFQDDFEEEEVVVDRYASLEAATFKNRPQVQSREGNELSRMLAAVKPCTTPVAKRSGPTMAEVEPVAVQATPPATTVEPWFRGADSSESGLDDDSDLLVVEELPREVTAELPTAAVRRQEYRQLFANLRRS